VRKTLEKLVRELEAKGNASGVGLFGSWSRGEATSASDIDLLILDDSNLKDEYVERITPSDLMVDLDHVPKQWINTVIPPDMDQKLYELQILFDRDWGLANTKLLMNKSYVSAERVSIRTEAHVVDSDIYLSRATSAFSREDYRSAYLFSAVALESILKVLVEIALQPFSNSHFVERLETSTARLGVPHLFTEYLNMARFEEINASIAKEKLRLFRLIWDEMNDIVRRHPQKLEPSHFRIRTGLKYYLNPAFLQGIVMRSNFMIDNEKLVESLHYLEAVFLTIVENYAWLKSSIDRIKIDNTLLLRSLENLEKKNPKNYEHIVDFLDLKNIERLDAARAIRKTKEIMLRIRKDRKVLIKNHLTKS
jgi:predicted nucleotidyltransferase